MENEKPVITGEKETTFPATVSSGNETETPEQGKVVTERLSTQQKLFFLLVIIFALFLVFLKFFLEKDIIRNSRATPKVSYGNYNPDYQLPGGPGFGDDYGLPDDYSTEGDDE